MAITLDAKKVTTVKKWLGSGSIDIFGMPFAGKDTQGHRLGQLLNAPVLGGGDILRNSVIPHAVKDIMHAGLLIPTQDYLEIVLPYLSQTAFINRPLILSAVGRWHGEEAGVLEATAESNHPLKVVIHLEISPQHVKDRWQSEHIHIARGHRIDDTAEALNVRLEEYRQKTIPVINFYRDENMLIEIDSSQSISAVTITIIDKLYEFSQII
jgi:adenylate kinase